MTAFLAVEFEPGAEPHFAVNALRQPALVIRSLDIGQREVVATVEVADAHALQVVAAAVRCRPGIRSSTAFAADA
ncbi:MAG: hypothetical protein R3181_09830 [Rubricoccaceae bacterium]|nr:hypothetical protein [Rubricoccaceae bacterium]